MTFHELQLDSILLENIKREGYTQPTPIQSQTIPQILAGRDVIGCAQTGTGKTAAFAFPIIQLLGVKTHTRHIRALILSPTRELAAQIGQQFEVYSRNTPLRHTVIFGGVGQTPQVEAIQRGVDILVATPGRLLDLMNQGIIHLNKLDIFVLDEADRMLDMGFIHDIKRVIKALPPQRQNLLFSATMPQEITKLSQQFLDNPVQIEVNPQSSTVDKIDQFVYFVERPDKKNLLKHILTTQTYEQVLIFTRTKYRANTLAKQLSKAHLPAEAIHGGKSQTARTRALDNFRAGKTKILVATDIAARGLDIEAVSHVINFDLPNIPESYVHRIGRTARAGADGTAYSFCDVDERAYLKDIEAVIDKKIHVNTDHPYVSTVPEVVVTPEKPKTSKPKSSNRRRRNNRNRNRNKKQE
jgi:ATP-dependent RNA helicase RhlE